MDLSRRGFIGGLGAILAAPAIVKASSLMPVRALVPTLYGDGIHDDTEALNYLFARGRIFTPTGIIKDWGDGIVIDGGHYKVSDTIQCTRRFHLRNAVFATNDSDKPTLAMRSTGSYVMGSHFTNTTYNIYREL